VMLCYWKPKLMYWLDFRLCREESRTFDSGWTLEMVERNATTVRWLGSEQWDMADWFAEVSGATRCR
jgi:hypothetical protein